MNSANRQVFAENLPLAPIQQGMPRRSLAKRFVGRLTREVKRLVGVDSYLRNEDRRILETVIFPYFLQREDRGDVLFVGCDWYTRGYSPLFEKRHNYTTIDPDPRMVRHGARRHIVDGLASLPRHFASASLDLILCNGVFGWGLDDRAEVECAFAACADALRGGGALVIGWDQVAEHQPFPPLECRSLHALDPFVFPPLGTAEYVTATSYRHTFAFFRKPALAGAVAR